jgi:hypothetical protein
MLNFEKFCAACTPSAVCVCVCVSVCVCVCVCVSRRRRLGARTVYSTVKPDAPVLPLARGSRTLSGGGPPGGGGG